MSIAGSRRSDARNNRQRLVAQAEALFSKAAGAVTMDMVAKAAGVGVGTLYRHFPTREALAEAVYQAELDELDRRVDDLLKAHTAFDAMQHWIDDYLRFVSAKRAMQDALRVAIMPGIGAATTVRSRINAIVGRFLRAGAVDGTLRDDVAPDDVTLGLVGMVLAATGASEMGQARRMLGLLTTGLRRRP